MFSESTYLVQGDFYSDQVLLELQSLEKTISLPNISYRSTQGLWPSLFFVLVLFGGFRGYEKISLE